MTTTIKFKSDGAILHVNDAWATQFIKDGIAEEYSGNATSFPFPISKKQAFTINAHDIESFRRKIGCIRLIIADIRTTKVSDSIAKELREELADGLEMGLDNALHDCCFNNYKTEEELAEEEHERFLEERHIREERSAYFSQVL